MLLIQKKLMFHIRLVCSQKLEFTLASRSSEPAKVSPEVVMDQLTKMFEGKAKNDLVIEWIEVKRIFGTIFLTILILCC